MNTCRKRNTACMDQVHHAVRPSKGLRDIQNFEVGVGVGTPSRNRNCMLIKLESGSAQSDRVAERKQRVVYVPMSTPENLTCLN